MKNKSGTLLIMSSTVDYANKEATKYAAIENNTAEIPLSVEFINWVSGHELEYKEGYIILKDK